MATPRNLFRLRTAEQAQADDQFLALFSSRVIDLFKEEQVWDRLVRIESAPGGGKTSLLRLFTPGSLTRVLRLRHQQENQDLVRQLQSLGVLDDRGIQLLGVYVNCHQDYSQIADLNLDPSQKLSWFIALLDARTILHMLQTVCRLARIRYPQDVERISLERRPDSVATSTHADSVTGTEIYQSARETESMIAGAINRLGRVPELELRASNRLDAPLLLSSHSTFVDGKQIANRALLMFDDTHTLDPAQQTLLEAELKRHDLSLARWMAMRLSALTPEQVMSEPTKVGREVLTIRLDDWTRPTFERWLIDIADRRAVRAEPSIQSFESLFADGLTTDAEHEAAIIAASKESAAVLEVARLHPELFNEWIREAERATETMAPSEAAIEWARLRILIERRLRRRQAEFDFVSLPASELARAPGEVIEPARLFVAARNELPYYFGAQKIAQLGSWNVEQFLALSADLFDALVNAGLVSQSGARELSARQQDRIIRACSRALLANIQRDVPYGVDVHNLVSAFGAMAKDETHRPTAPYAPGVTGFAISMADRATLLRAQASDPSNGSARLLRALHAAVAHNILNPSLDRRVKGGAWMVLYLNRLLCPAFELPLGYGGFREQSVSEVKRWVADGSPSARRQLRLA
jgi:hypothetical protein